MSSFLSPAYSETKIQETFDVNLADKVMTAKQGKYDVNKAKVDATLAAYKNQLRGMRDMDNEYIAGRLNEVQTLINKQGTIDYGSNATTDVILSTAMGVMEDPIVRDAILSKAKKDKFDAEVAEVKKKDPKLYSDRNYSFALYKAGNDAYMKGETNNIGSLTYKNYVDVTEEHLKRLKQVKDIKGKRYIEEIVDESGNVNPNGKFKRKKEIEGLTENEIQDYMGTLISPDEKEQMVINGWYNFGRDEQGARKVYSDYKDKQLIDVETNIDLYEKRAKNTNLTDAVRDNAKAQVLVLKDKQTAIKSKKENLKNIPIDDIGYELEKGNYLNGISQIAASEWSQSLETNDVYYKDRQLEIDYEDLKIKKEKDERDKIEHAAKMKKDYGVGTDGEPAVDGVVEVSASEVNTEDLEDQIGQETLHDRHNAYYGEILSTAKGLLTNPKVREDDKKVFKAELKARNLDENLKWIDPKKVGSASTATTIKAAFDASKIGKVYKKEAETITHANFKKQSIAKDIVSTENESYTKVFNENSFKYVDIFNGERISNDMNAQGEEDAPVFTTHNSILKSRELQKETDEFIKKVGGVSNVENYLKNNPSQIRGFSNLIDKLQSRPSYIPFLPSLKGNAKAETERILQDKSKVGGLSGFTDNNTINFTNESVNESIIKGFNQDNIKGEVFNAKQPLTAKLSGNDIIVTQYKGTTTGEKGAINSGLKNSTITLSPGDSSYRTMLKYIQIKEDELGNLNADTTSAKMDAYKPSVIDAKNESKTKFMAYNLLNAVTENPNIKTLFASVGGDPTVYRNDESITNTFEAKLYNYPKDKVDAFVKSYVKRLDNFKVTPYVDLDMVNGGNTWNIKIENEYGKTITDKSLNLKNLDKNMLWIIENAPETIISEYLLRDLIKDTKQTKIQDILDPKPR